MKHSLFGIVRFLSIQLLLSIPLKGLVLHQYRFIIAAYQFLLIKKMRKDSLLLVETEEGSVGLSLKSLTNRAPFIVAARKKFQIDDKRRT